MKSIYVITFILLLVWILGVELVLRRGLPDDLVVAILLRIVLQFIIPIVVIAGVVSAENPHV